MKQLIKKIRAIPFINVLIRNLFKGMQKLGIKFSDEFLHHIVVSGIVSIKTEKNTFFKLFSKGDDFIPTKVYWGGYDAYEKAAIPFYYLSKKSQTIIDIGANIGFYSLLASAANPNANIYSFEPVPRLVERFEKHIEINSFKNISIEEIAVSNKNGVISFYVPIGDTMALASSVNEDWLGNSEKISVNSETLFSYKKRAGLAKIDLIKMDCEFHELEVLHGMSDILEEDGPVILMEVLFPESEGVKGYYENNQYMEIQQIMTKYNYQFYQIHGMEIKWVENLEYYPEDRNYLFIKKRFETDSIPFSDIII